MHNRNTEDWAQEETSNDTGRVLVGARNRQILWPPLAYLHQDDQLYALLQHAIFRTHMFSEALLPQSYRLLTLTMVVNAIRIATGSELTHPTQRVPEPGGESEVQMAISALRNHAQAGIPRTSQWADHTLATMASLLDNAARDWYLDALLEVGQGSNSPATIRTPAFWLLTELARNQQQFPEALRLSNVADIHEKLRSERNKKVTSLYDLVDDGTLTSDQLELLLNHLDNIPARPITTDEELQQLIEDHRATAK